MLTYKIIDRNEEYIKYIYFPYGKDMKVSGGIVTFNKENKEYKIEEVAQLDIREELTDEEIDQIVNHINLLRKKDNFPILTKVEFIEKNVNYIFASKLIKEILQQIESNNIKEKGIIF